MGTPSKCGAVPGDCITLAWRNRAAKTAAGWAIVAVGLTVAIAASGETGQFTSGVNLVEVYASVTDARGEPVTGLTQQDFEVRESGKLQQISNFAAGEVPLSVAVALDRSFSMSGRRLELAKVAAHDFLGELRPSDESMVIAIGSEVEIVAPLSADRRQQFDALMRLDPFGTTGLHDAIIQAIENVQPARGRRALVLLSDGDDRYSHASADDALERARRSDVMIFPVALGQSRPPLFAELATLTGGRSSQARDAATLTATLRAIARELRQQYLLGYTPERPPVAGSGEWRSITVTVKRQNMQVRARDGYVVK
jgi:Ca-activated chloride channel family protein